MTLVCWCWHNFCLKSLQGCILPSLAPQCFARSALSACHDGVQSEEHSVLQATTLCALHNHTGTHHVWWQLIGSKLPATTHMLLLICISGQLLCM